VAGLEERVREHPDDDREHDEPDNGLQLEEVDEHAANRVDLHDFVLAAIGAVSASPDDLVTPRRRVLTDP
jgi:hypothetical protein